MRNIILPVRSEYAECRRPNRARTGIGSHVRCQQQPRLTGNYSLQHSRDTATGQDAGLAPHRRIFGRADWRFAPLWQFGTTVNYVANRMREPGDTRAPVPDYTMVNLTLRREKLPETGNVRAMVTNLFNSDAREPTLMSAGTTIAGNPVTISDLPLSGTRFLP